MPTSQNPYSNNEMLTCGINTLSPGVTEHAILLPSLSIAPGPTASTLASFRSFTLDSGRKMPLAVFASALMRWTKTRSRRGTRLLMDRMVDWRRLIVSFARCGWIPQQCFVGDMAEGRRKMGIYHYFKKAV